MASLPATLLYFVIYNPQLKRAGTHAGSESKDEQEDAEEQAQVLFYTAKDHAVSKDRVLRQVGLAKALVNFSNMFGTQDTCEAVHSQCRRMLMLQPETDYWMHACIELSKTTRPPPKEDKSNKGKPKSREVQYDYSEYPLQDGALRAQIQLAYESFKIKHGTFASIFASLGKEALELQLERFFTVWAWSWNLEKSVPFSDYIGVRLHPLSNQLLPIIEASLGDRLPPHLTPILISQDQFISTRDKASQYPPYLARHLLSIVLQHTSRTERMPLTQDNTPTLSMEATSSPAMGATEKDDKAKSISDLGRKAPPKGGTLGKRLLAVPQASMNATMSAMDVRKWSWPGYLTFGQSKDDQISEEVAKSNGNLSGDIGSAPSGVEGSDPPPPSSTSSISSAGSHNRVESMPDVPVDSQALLDAFSNLQPSSTAFYTVPQVTSEVLTTSEESNGTDTSRKRDNDLAPTSPNTECQEQETHELNSTSTESAEDSDVPTASGSRSEGLEIVQSSSRSEGGEQSGDKLESDDDSNFTETSTGTPPSFSTTLTYLQLGGPLECKPSRVSYLCHEGLLIALLNANSEESNSDMDEELAQHLALCSRDLLEKLQSIIEDEEGKIAVALQPTTVQTVLQKSQYAIELAQDTSYASPSFSSTSWHLHEAHKTLQCSPNVTEIYSRRQNPQDWHLAKRITTSVDSKDSASRNSVFMEIGRKEASLPDVDGELAGVVRRCLG